ncbi:MAG: hypothetical protein GY913_05175 [Proteobacteria bacterium]|nr:hypothetical protein [Pseudomonadota bacterium]MCP4916293.1 hypothetical protein [Pseudomonadota bacterium]
MPQHSVRGPLGRTFNRILKKADNASDSASMAFDRNQLKDYLDKNLQLAEGEWFRGKKLDGVADALMGKLDKAGDGKVSWDEFQSFRSDVLATLGAAAGANDQEVQAAAGSRFNSMDKNRDGELGMGEIQSKTRQELPRDTDHKDLIAQLGARISLDAVDQDDRQKDVANRRLSRTEWVQAAKELAGG